MEKHAAVVRDRRARLVEETGLSVPEIEKIDKQAERIAMTGNDELVDWEVPNPLLTAHEVRNSVGQLFRTDPAIQNESLLNPPDTVDPRDLAGTSFQRDLLNIRMRDEFYVASRYSGMLAWDLFMAQSGLTGHFTDFFRRADRFRDNMGAKIVDEFSRTINRWMRHPVGVTVPRTGGYNLKAVALPMDSGGWVRMDHLRNRLNNMVSRRLIQRELTMMELQFIVLVAGKSRFQVGMRKRTAADHSVRMTWEFVRVAQGHSLEFIRMERLALRSPDMHVMRKLNQGLWHHTEAKNVESILMTGIQPANRPVHLAFLAPWNPEASTAYRAGASTYGVFFRVDLDRLYDVVRRDSVFVSTSGSVLCVDAIPSYCIESVITLNPVSRVYTHLWHRSWMADVPTQVAIRGNAPAALRKRDEIRAQAAEERSKAEGRSSGSSAALSGGQAPTQGPGGTAEGRSSGSSAALPQGQAPGTGERKKKGTRDPAFRIVADWMKRPIVMETIANPVEGCADRTFKCPICDARVIAGSAKVCGGRKKGEPECGTLFGYRPRPKPVEAAVAQPTELVQAQEALRKLKREFLSRPDGRARQEEEGHHRREHGLEVGHETEEPH